MPPTLGNPFPPTWPGHPPHMSQRDFELWQRWRHPHALDFHTLYFDVALGMTDPDPLPPDLKLGDMWKRLTAFRADVIGRTLTAWAIIELRDTAGPGAIGALLTYAQLWRRDPPNHDPVDLILVTNLINNDLLPILNLNGIALAIV